MISLDAFPEKGEGPIYQRLVDFIKSGIASGEIRDGDELPSRRVVSARLGVNPNTVQKAYRILEEEGLIASRAGAKSCAEVSAETQERVRRELRLRQISRVVSALKASGMEKTAALELISRLWDSQDLGEEELEI